MYIQVSRNLGALALKKNIDGIALKDLIEKDWGNWGKVFGNFGDLDDYKNNLSDDDVQAFGELFIKDKEDEDRARQDQKHRV